MSRTGSQIHIAAATCHDGFAIRQGQVATFRVNLNIAVKRCEIAANGEGGATVVDIDAGAGADGAERADGVPGIAEQHAAAGAGRESGGVADRLGLGDVTGAAGGQRHRCAAGGVDAVHAGHAGDLEAVGIVIADGAVGQDRQFRHVVLGMRERDCAGRSHCQLRRDNRTGLGHRCRRVDGQGARGRRAANVGRTGRFGHADIRAAQDQAAEAVARIVQGDPAAIGDRTAFGREAGNSTNADVGVRRLHDAGFHLGPDRHRRACRRDSDRATDAVASIVEDNGIAVDRGAGECLAGRQTDHRIIAGLIDIAKGDDARLAQFGHGRCRRGAADQVAGTAHHQRCGSDVEVAGHLHIGVGQLCHRFAGGGQGVIAADRGSPHRRGVRLRIGDADIAGNMGGFQPEVAADHKRLGLGDAAASLQRHIGRPCPIGNAGYLQGSAVDRADFNAIRVHIYQRSVTRQACCQNRGIVAGMTQSDIATRLDRQLRRLQWCIRALGDHACRFNAQFVEGMNAAHRCVKMLPG